MTRRQWIAAALVLVGGLLLGVVQALAWARLAPGVDYRRGDGDAFYQMPTSSAHAFASVAIFTMLGVAIGVIGALVVWQIRCLRGPSGIAATLIAALGSGFLGFLLAPDFVTGLDFGTPAGVTTTAPPALDTPLVAIVTAAAAALVYSLAAFLDGRPDLGTGIAAAAPLQAGPWGALPTYNSEGVSGHSPPVSPRGPGDPYA